MTFGERQKRANLKLIERDMDEIELAFLSDSQRLNKKRHQLLMKSVKRCSQSS
ncbi:head morphogenesis [Staphylococcus phage MVC_VPHSA1]|uniref:Head morphogenesis n=1 Tax=Staphylococcus phage MVC_VPHSA1 TaxID=3088876 RepID=A0ABZ0QYK6_9CAUD|nr:head morphogenesis [Staphylococcus phage MVC_VPHSA1]